MAAQRGKDFLLKVFSDTQSAYITIAGLRSRRIVLNQQTIDVTDSESVGRWRELLDGSGVRRMSVSASGIFKDRQSDEALRAAFFATQALNCQLAVPDFGVIEGSFLITALEYSGAHDGEMTFDIALESAGAISFGAL